MVVVEWATSCAFEIMVNPGRRRTSICRPRRIHRLRFAGKVVRVVHGNGVMLRCDGWLSRGFANMEQRRIRSVRTGSSSSERGSAFEGLWCKDAALDQLFIPRGVFARSAL